MKECQFLITFLSWFNGRTISNQSSRTWEIHIGSVVIYGCNFWWGIISSTVRISSRWIKLLCAALRNSNHLLKIPAQVVTHLKLPAASDASERESSAVRALFLSYKFNDVLRKKGLRLCTDYPFCRRALLNRRVNKHKTHSHSMQRAYFHFIFY